MEAQCCIQANGGASEEGVLLFLTLTNKEGLAGKGKVWDSRGCSGHRIMEFSILCGATGRD